MIIDDVIDLKFVSYANMMTAYSLKPPLKY